MASAAEAAGAKEAARQAAEENAGAPKALGDVALPDCVICFDGPASHLVVPCGHQCVCHKCVLAQRCVTMCPICRGGVEACVRGPRPPPPPTTPPPPPPPPPRRDAMRDRTGGGGGATSAAA